MATAVLSTTAKAKARAKKSEKDKAGDHMDVDKEPEEPTKATEEEDTAKEEQRRKAGKKKKEENYSILENLARVVPAQLKRVTFKDDSRYVPIKKGTVSGIIMMEDRKPNEEEELIEPSAPTSGKGRFIYSHTD